VAANAIEVTLPSDTVLPIELGERANNTTDLFSGVEEVDDIPEMDQLEYIAYWTWREEHLYINSPSTAREVKLKYWKSLAAITGDSSSISVLNSTEYLANKTAALCARYIGENPTRADALDGEAERALHMMLAVEAKSKQNRPVRPRGYGSHNWS
jgi:hypothetical protein